MAEGYGALWQSGMPGPGKPNEQKHAARGGSRVSASVRPRGRVMSRRPVSAGGLAVRVIRDLQKLCALRANEPLANRMLAVGTNTRKRPAGIGFDPQPAMGLTDSAKRSSLASGRNAIPVGI